MTDSIYRTPFGSAVEIDPIHTAYTGEQPNEPLLRELQRRLEAEPLRRGAVLEKDVQLPEQRRHQQEPRRLPHPRADHRVLRLQRPLLRRHRPRGPQQPAARGVAVVLRLHELAWQARHQGRLRELPLHAHGRQLAVLDRLGLLRGLAHRRRRQAGLRQRGLRDPGVRDRLQLCHQLPGHPGGPDRPHHAGGLRERPLDAQQPLVLQPRRPRRVGEGRGHGRDPAGQREPHRAAPGRVVRRRAATASSSSTRPIRTTPASTAKPSSRRTPTWATPTRSTTSTPGPPARAAASPRASTSPTTPRSSAAASPTANVFYDENIKSPVTKEWTAAAGVQLGNKGYIKAIYTHRKVTDFVQVFVNTSTGTTTVVKNGVDFGTFSNRALGRTPTTACASTTASSSRPPTASPPAGTSRATTRSRSTTTATRRAKA